MAEVDTKRAGSDASGIRPERAERTSLDKGIAHQNIAAAITGHGRASIPHIRTGRSAAITALIGDRDHGLSHIRIQERERH